MCGGSEAGVSAGCGRCTASVWRLGFSQSLGACGGERTHRDPGSVPHTHGSKTPSDRAAGRQAGRQSGAAWSCEGCGPTWTCSPNITLSFVYLQSASFFIPKMETTGCWLLLAAHFILFCQQGKTDFHSCFILVWLRNPETFLKCLNCIETELHFSTGCANFEVIAQVLCPKQTNRRSPRAVCVFVS